MAKARPRWRSKADGGSVRAGTCRRQKWYSSRVRASPLLVGEPLAMAGPLPPLAASRSRNPGCASATPQAAPLLLRHEHQHLDARRRQFRVLLSAGIRVGAEAEA